MVQTIKQKKDPQALKAKVHSEVIDYDFDVKKYPLTPGVEEQVQQDHCLISPLLPKESTKGGIILATSTMQAAEHLAQLGRIEAVGPLWYGLSPWDRVPEEKRLKVGDFVAFRAYSSAKIGLNDKFLITPLSAILWQFSPEALSAKGVDLKIYA